MTDRNWGVDGITSYHHYEGGSCTFTARRLWRDWYWSPGVGLVWGEVALDGAWQAIADDLKQSRSFIKPEPDLTQEGIQ